MKNQFLNYTIIPINDLLMDFERKGIELPTAVRSDIISYITMSYVANVNSVNPQSTILSEKVNELKLLYPRSFPESKVILALN